MGKTDAVPGLFHVETRFWHIDFLPIVPIQSFLVLQVRGEANRLVKIPLWNRSVVAAWLRVVSVIFVISTAVIPFAFWDSLVDGDDVGLVLITVFILFIASCCLVYVAWCGKKFRDATYERASQLCLMLGPTNGPVTQRLVDRHFERYVLVEATVLSGDDNAVDGFDAASPSIVNEKMSLSEVV